MLRTWVSLITAAQYGLVWNRRSNTCVMCICFLLFFSIVSDCGSGSVLLGPARNVLCQIWELNEIHWLWCDDDKSLCGKQMKYVLYQLIIHHEQMRNVLWWSRIGNVGHILLQLMIIYKHAILPVITYAAEVWHRLISKRAQNKLQQIQRTFLIFLIKAYRSVSLDALQAIAGLMPIEQAVSLYKDTWAISRGKPTDALVAQLRKIETPIKMKNGEVLQNSVSYFILSSR